MTPPVRKAALAGAHALNLVTQALWGRKWVVGDQKRLWSRRAVNWREEMAGLDRDPYYRAFSKRLLAVLGALPETHRFLEVGCFFGNHLGKLQEAFPEKSAVGLDRVWEALAAGRSGGCPSGGPFVQGDAVQLPFRTNSVDCLYTVVSLTHIPPDRLDAALLEMVRVARKFLVLVEIYDRLMKPARRWRTWAWGSGYCHPYERHLRGKGLSLKRVEPLPDGEGHARYTLFLCEKDDGG